MNDDAARLHQASAAPPTISVETTRHAPEQGAVGAEARWFERATPVHLALLQWGCALVMVYVLLAIDVPRGNKGMMMVTESIGALERVALWQRSLWWLPGARAGGRFFTLPPEVIANVFRIVLVGMFILQGWSFWQAWRGHHTTFWKWLLGPIGAHIIMLAMVPANSDVFFYEMSGDLANHGTNPYLYPLYDFPTHPILPYIHWVDMTTVYGPLWTDIDRVIMSITGPAPFWGTLVFKVGLGLSALALALLSWRLAFHLTGSRRLATAAGVLIAWQPNMIMETSGQAHNDPVMLLLATAGLFLVVVGGMRALRGAIVLVTASAAIKYVTLPLVGLLGMLRIGERKRRGWPAIAGSWGLDILAVAAVLLASFLPYWGGFTTLREMLLEPGRLIAQPVWNVLFLVIRHFFPGTVTHVYSIFIRTVMQLATFALLAWAAWRFLRALWDESRPAEDTSALPWWIGPLLTAWTAVVATLSLVPVNSHAWYWTWPVVPIALLIVFRSSQASDDDTPTPLPRWFWAYLVLNGVLVLVYHTRIAH